MRKSLTFFLFLGLLLVTLNFVFAKVEVDTDKDGLGDYEEQNVYKTKSDNTDSDGDGYQDGEEVYHGYSPIQGQLAKLSRVVLTVPYITEAPDGNWTGP